MAGTILVTPEIKYVRYDYQCPKCHKKLSGDFNGSELETRLNKMGHEWGECPYCKHPFDLDLSIFCKEKNRTVCY